MLEIDDKLREIVEYALRYSLEHAYALAATIEYIMSNQRMFSDEMVRTMYYLTSDRAKIKDLNSSVQQKLEDFNSALKSLLDESR